MTEYLWEVYTHMYSNTYTHVHVHSYIQSYTHMYSNSRINTHSNINSHTNTHSKHFQTLTVCKNGIWSSFKTFFMSSLVLLMFKWQSLGAGEIAQLVYKMLLLKAWRPEFKPTIPTLQGKKEEEKEVDVHACHGSAGEVETGKYPGTQWPSSLT